MEPAQIARALSIFEDALEIDPSERAGWLDAVCAGDGDLLTYVQRLLKADRLAERAMPTGDLVPLETPMPDRIGRYRIVDRLGQGGMGDVYVGARDDGLFDHAVAIKRVRPTMFAETARMLFERERRALASLHHRHIAQLYDGGVDESGAPYLIMELVRGVPLDDFAHSVDLPPRRIVEMMIAICGAVQHAHQNLIVHADLKPANILVNEAGDPKVVDFGVARVLGEAGESAVHPQTPGYASPQRAAGAAPTPADDVFALGAILRALLTGEAPRGSSQTLSTSQAIERSEGFATRPAHWRTARARTVVGDLDAIIARACAPRAEDRYPAAVALAADLGAWLEIRPIAARATDRMYVVRQFVRRRRWRVAAIAAATAGLIVALSVTAVLYAQADGARREAEARFTEVRKLANYLLRDVYDRLERTPQTLAMRRDVARVAQGYLNALAETPSAPPDVLLEAAEGLVRVADLQAGRSRANLGEEAAAFESLGHASAIAGRVGAAGAGEAVFALRAGIAIREAALAMNSRQDLDRAATLLGSAAIDIASMSEGRRKSLLRVQHELESAIHANWKGVYDEGEAHASRAIAIAMSLPSDPADVRELHSLLVRALDAQAEAVYYGEGESASEPIYRRLVTLAAGYAAANPDDMQGVRLAIEAHWALGVTLLSINRAPEALTQMDAANSLMPTLLRYQPDDEGARRTERIVLGARAQALAMNGRFAEGVVLLSREVERSAAAARAAGALPVQARTYAINLAMLADLHADNGATRTACPLYAQADAIFDDLARRGHLSQLDRDSSQRMVHEQQGRHCR